MFTTGTRTIFFSVARDAAPRRGNDDEKLDAVFGVFDMNNDGYISMDEVPTARVRSHVKQG